MRISNIEQGIMNVEVKKDVGIGQCSVQGFIKTSREGQFFLKDVLKAKEAILPLHDSTFLVRNSIFISME